MKKNSETSKTFHNLSAEGAFGIFNSGQNGLSDVQVSDQLKIYGKNELPKDKPFSVFKLLIRQFNNPLAFVLLFAMVLSFFLKHFSDGMIIALVVFVSGMVGFMQELKANKALSELSSIVKYKARVVRGGVLSIIDQADIVPGDLIDICPGDIIPADARLVLSHNLKINESVLTGEALPSIKTVDALTIETTLADRDNMVFQGTSVSEGVGRAVVVATGKDTEMGKIASLIKETDEVITPLQKQVQNFAKWLSAFLVAANVAIFAIGVILGRPFFEMFMISVAVVVSAVPAALAPAMSIVLALGMQKLIKKRGLVRQIISAETLGAVSVICTDKTGTLTEGEMSVEKIITAEHEIEIGKKKAVDLIGTTKKVLEICVISNDAVIDSKDTASKDLSVVGNMTDRSMLLAGDIYGMRRKDLEKAEKRLHELPFSSDAKIMATLHEGQQGNVIYVKGAPEKIFAKTEYVLQGGQEKRIDKEFIEFIDDKIAKLTSAGQRILAVAYQQTKKKKISNNDLSSLVFVGLVVIKDKIRHDAAEAVALCHKAGVKAVMITGDHANTALAIANEAGINANSEQVITGIEIDELDEDLLAERLKNTLVYARVEPRHKLKIVSFLQNNDEVVAMTGDGINDAPALKKADIGVAMGNGTDVSKEVADLVLLDSSFMTIVEAIKQGRTTFANIRKVLVYLFTDCFQEMVVIGSAVLFGWPLPITPVQILWIKLVESPLPATSLSFEESNHDVLLDKPRGRKEQLLTGKLKFNIAFYAFVMDVIALSVFYYYWKSTGDVDKARTLVFVALGMSTLFNIYNIRSLGESVFKVNPFKNRFLVFATIIGFLLFLLAVYSKFMNGILNTVPLGVSDWFVISLYSVASLLVFETGKKLMKYKI